MGLDILLECLGSHCASYRQGTYTEHLLFKNHSLTACKTFRISSQPTTMGTVRAVRRDEESMPLEQTAYPSFLAQRLEQKTDDLCMLPHFNCRNN